MKVALIALLALVATTNAANIRTGAEPETAEAKEHVMSEQKDGKFI